MTNLRVLREANKIFTQCRFTYLNASPVAQGHSNDRSDPEARSSAVIICFDLRNIKRRRYWKDVLNLPE
jgi:hypothetical protein